MAAPCPIRVIRVHPRLSSLPFASFVQFVVSPLCLRASVCLCVRFLAYVRPPQNIGPTATPPATSKPAQPFPSPAPAAQAPNPPPPPGPPPHHKAPPHSHPHSPAPSTAPRASPHSGSDRAPAE